MSQPTSYGGRPLTPAPGAPVRELRVARFRGHARRMTWPALILIAAAAGCGYLYDNLPAPLQSWMLLTATALVVLFLVLLPFLSWWGRSYTITTDRVLVRTGMLVSRRRELRHERGYTVAVRRGPIQRMWRTGTLTLSNGVDEPLRLVDIPHVHLVHEVLVDQVEVSQILAHRALPVPGEPPVPPPPRRPE